MIEDALDSNEKSPLPSSRLIKHGVLIEGKHWVNDAFPIVRSAT